MSDIGEVGLAYRGVRERVTALVAATPSTATMVAACPAWRVHDLVAHLTGVAADLTAGNVEGAGSDPWTAAQVEARRDRATADVLAEWDQLGPPIEAMLDQLGPPGRQTVMDAVTHEHDLRGALGQPGARDSDAVLIGSGWLGNVARRVAPLLVRSTTGEEWTPSDGEPVATLTVEPFDLLRSFTGRRTEAEIRALDWDGDVDALVPSAFTFGPFAPRSDSLGE